MRYAKKATELCHSVLNLVDNVSDYQFEDSFLKTSKIHFSLILIQVYAVKGQILETDRHFNVAYDNYKQARAISIVINGPNHQNTIELTIAVNRTLIRCKREPRFNFSEKDLGDTRFL